MDGLEELDNLSVAIVLQGFYHCEWLTSPIRLGMMSLSHSVVMLPKSLTSMIAADERVRKERTYTANLNLASIMKFKFRL